ncbi:MAG: hypothetical protein VW475_02020 [Curvibacter sp.]
MQPSSPTAALLAAGARLGLRGLLVLLLAGLFWCWTLATAQPAPLLDVGEGEMAYWVMADAEDEDLEPGETTVASGRDLICRKPVPYKPGVDLVLNEIADKEVHSRERLWLALPQAVPAQGPLPALPQVEPQPLLRPPARLV